MISVLHSLVIGHFALYCYGGEGYCDKDETLSVYISFVNLAIVILHCYDFLHKCAYVCLDSLHAY